MTMNHEAGRGEIEDLLPWHAAGALNQHDAEAVEMAIARDPELMRRFMLAREEMAATVELNEALGHPSPRALTRLLAAIDAEGGRRQLHALSLVSRLGLWIGGLTPRQLAFAATVAAVAILIQAGVIGGLLTVGQGPAQQTASNEQTTDARYAFVGFDTSASAGDIAALLAANHVSIVDGPRPGGVYRVRIAALEQENGVVTRGVETSPEQHRAEVLANLRAAKNLVRFAMPTQ